MIKLKFLVYFGTLLRLSAEDKGGEGCCLVKEVSDTKNGLDGTYKLFRQADPPDGLGCKNDCVYKKDDDNITEYCFKAVSTDAPYVECFENDCVREEHPCNRVCKPNQEKTCHFTLTTELLKTDTDGRRADGRVRPVTTYNGLLPGPLLVVCEGDNVEVTLVNNIVDGPVTNSDGSSNSTTLHFHGIRDVNNTKSPPMFNPWSDGVPFVTQCPVPGAKKGSESATNKFLHKFKAEKPGTYWYHSHRGAQRTNGLEGGLIIKDKNPNKHPYAEFKNKTVIDEPDCQSIILQEWYQSPTCVVPVSILVNGKSRIKKKINGCGDVNATNRYLRGLGASFPKVDQNPTHKLRNVPDTSYEIFNVKPSQVYRFRIMGLIGQNFPIRFSIDNHTFSAIATDSLYIEEVPNLTNLWIAAGERYDILLETRTKKDVSEDSEAFKMRFVGFGDITDNTTAVCSIAWLIYPKQTIDDSYVTNCTDFDDLLTPSNYPPPQRTLNPPGIRKLDWDERLTTTDWKIPTKIGSIYPLDLRSYTATSFSNVIKDETQFIKFDKSTTFNGIRTNYSDVPYLLQSTGKERHCNVNTKDEEQFHCDINRDYCVCPHVIQLRYVEDGWVDLILISSSDQKIAHPIHQHGGWYWVVGGDVLEEALTRDTIKRLYDEEKLEYKNDTDIGKSIGKDVIQVPRNGYVILRTPLNNTGNWLFHCHVDFHLSVGMALVLQIGNQSDWNLGPLETQVDKPCSDKPPNPLGGNARINWIFQEDVLHEPPKRCVMKNQNVTFFWVDPDYVLGGPNPPPYDYRDHNVNYIGTGEAAKKIFDDCTNNAPQTLPSLKEMKTEPDTPNQDYTFTMGDEEGWHYFYCSLRDHCENYNVKAKVYVVTDDMANCFSKSE